MYYLQNPESESIYTENTNSNVIDALVEVFTGNTFWTWSAFHWKCATVNSFTGQWNYYLFLDCISILADLFALIFLVICIFHDTEKIMTETEITTESSCLCCLVHSHRCIYRDWCFSKKKTPRNESKHFNKQSRKLV